MALVRTLVVAGFKRGRSSFLGLLFLMALTAAALTFTICMYVDLNARESAALAEIGAGDVYATDLASNLTEEVATEIEELDEVGEVRLNDALGIPVKFYDETGAAIDKNPTSSTGFAAWGDALDFRLLAGDGASLLDAAPEPGPDEVYAPISLLVSPGVEVGDELEAIVGTETRRLTIAGFFEDPQMGTPFLETKRYLVAAQTYRELEAQVDAAFTDHDSTVDLFSPESKLASYRIAEINIHLSDEARAQGMTATDLTRLVADRVAWANTASGMFSADTLTGYAMMVPLIGSAVMGVFALLLFVISLVICTRTISASLEEYYVDYGTLKALGVSNRTLRTTLVAEYVSVSFLGLAVGLGLGSVLVPLVLPFFAQLTGVLANNAAVPVAAIVVLSALLVLVAAVVVLKASKLSRISPLVAFRGGASDVHFRSRAVRPLGGRSLNLQLAVRSIASAKRRYVGLAGCSFAMCAFIVLVFGIGGTLNGPNAAVDAFGMWISDASVSLASPDVEFEEVERVIEDVTPIEKSWKESFAMVSFDGESHTFAGLSDLSLVKGVTEGRVPKFDNEALIGTNLAKTMGLSVGDELVVDGADGEERTFLVCGLLSAMFNAGYGTILTYDGVCDLAGRDSEALEATRQYALADPGKAAEVRAAVEERFGDKVDAQPTGMFSDTSEMIGLIQTLFTVMGYAMTVVAAALVFLAVSLIIGRMFSAEQHDLGVYRAIGFTSRALRVQFALRFFLVALVGCVLGALTAALGGSWLMGQLFGLFGVSRFALDANPLMVAGLAVGLALVFLVAAYVSARKVKRVDVRELVAE